MDSERKVGTKDGVEESALRELVEVTKGLTEGDFYRELNVKLYGELGRLAEYIIKTRKNLQHVDPSLKDTYKKMPQAALQLSDITKSTEEATHKILSLTEEILDNQELISNQIEKLEAIDEETSDNGKGLSEVIQVMNEINTENQNNLIEMLTTMSFQDLTGQKIKKIIGLVEEVETRVLEMIVAFGIKIEDVESQGEETEKKEELICQLKDSHMSVDSKQDLVDDILAGIETGA